MLRRYLWDNSIFLFFRSNTATNPTPTFLEPRISDLLQYLPIDILYNHTEELNAWKAIATAKQLTREIVLHTYIPRRNLIKLSCLSRGLLIWK